MDEGEKLKNTQIVWMDPLPVKKFLNNKETGYSFTVFVGKNQYVNKHKDSFLELFMTIDLKINSEKIKEGMAKKKM
jgi:hypothetical protein